MQTELNTMIIQYLNHLKTTNSVADIDQLDVAISCLKDTFKVQDNISSPELLTIVSQRENNSGETSESLKNKGNEAMKAKNFEDAQIFYTKAIDRSIRFGEPTEARSIYLANRAMARHDMSDLSNAVKDLREALVLNPSYTKGNVRLATYLEEDNLKEQANQEWKKLLAQDSNNSSYQQGVERTKLDAPPQIPDLGELKDKIPGLGDIQNDPEFAEMMKNPKVQQLAEQVKTNPMAAMSALSDPELAPYFQKIMAKLAPGLGDMFGGMGGAGGANPFGGMFGGQ
ncbi:Small glutamine-rich tetratricopeptide repeat-containing protein [Spironucleus salmonicida]|uniref:Small glutamine-rich tetratricopeptide repeat-containing protein n=1 Tax=Spironucleus salmonicida TaxID=348837 RepID=V6LE80_9EUKA|nr:Small glutamine-rich tetratricopeptide repeat-containing protein [Spironucleus salmonicida]|eukprot:EST42001.1 Small glutamine-rich tetratricopeptide repeat-containing protein [Spironucleus salmonicida]